MRIAIVGATGVVGRECAKLLDSGFIEYESLRLLASPRSAGTRIALRGQEYTVEELGASSFADIDVAVFSAGTSVALEYAPIAAEAGAVVVDNSSAFRMEADVPLVVPEVNPKEAQNRPRGIVANPNCSTIQAAVVLKPLADAYGLRRIIYSTYQAVSGAGAGGIRDLEEGMKGAAPTTFKHPIHANIIPQIDAFLEDGYTKEEAKMINETRKILGLPDLRITATTVRVPIPNVHSLSINVEMERGFEIEDIRSLMTSAPGITLVDAPEKFAYPMPIDADGKDDVLVGRIRRDYSQQNTINIWCSADNLRKGAALNALQIAKLVKRV